MAIIKKLIPALEIDLGTRKLFYSNQSFSIQDGNTIKQFEGKLKSDGGIQRSFNIFDFKASLTVSNNVSVINEQRLQDIFDNNPESLTNMKLYYLYDYDMTAKIDEITGIGSASRWDKATFEMNVKDSQKLYFKSVPDLIFDDKTFQISTILSEVSVQIKDVELGDPSDPNNLQTRTCSLLKNLISPTLKNKPENFWKGSRIDCIYDSKPSDHTDNSTGQFAVVVRSFDSTVFFNDNVDNFQQNDVNVAYNIINNTHMTVKSGGPGTTVYSSAGKTYQLVKNSVPENSESIGKPIPILYGAPEKVPMVWAIGQKSTRTNSFGVGDDIYLMASHICKLGVLQDSTAIISSVTTTGADNGVYKYTPDSLFFANKDQLEVTDGLRVEVYWSLEDKRVLDAKISPDNKNWIPNPFPKRWPNAVTSGVVGKFSWRDHPIRLLSPLHRVTKLKTLRGDVVQAVQLRGGELDWFSSFITTPLEQRAQYPVRYGMGNSKLYVSAEGYEDDLDGFYTGHIKSTGNQFNGLRIDDLENEKQNTLIKNPADVMLHFLMNYTSVNKNRSLIDIESFRNSRRMMDGWRVDTAITEITSGEEFVSRLCRQFCSIVFIDRGKFKMKTIIPSKMNPTFFFREGEHISKQSFEFTRTEDVYNDFILKYKFDYPNDQYSGVIKRNKNNDSACAKSFAKNKFERSIEPIELRDVADQFTANQILDVMIDLYSKRRTFLTCEVIYNQESVDSKVEIGDCVAVTTSQAPNGWINKPCIVLETRKTLEKMDLRLMEI